MLRNFGDITQRMALEDPPAHSGRSNWAEAVATLASDLAQSVRHLVPEELSKLLRRCVRQADHTSACVRSRTNTNSGFVWGTDSNGTKSLDISESAHDVPEAVRVEVDRFATILKGTDVKSQVLLRFDFMTSKVTRVSVARQQNNRTP